MTVSSTTRQAGPYHGNDIVAAFPFAFKVFAATDMYIVQSDDSTGDETVLVLNSGYTVTLNADQDTNPGGTVTLPDALPTGQSLVVGSAVPPTQNVSLTNLGGFYPAVVNTALDKLTILVQQLNESAERSIRFPVSDPGTTTPEIPAAGFRASKYLAFDASGNPIAASSSPGTTVVSAFMATVLDDANAAAARATLGVPSSTMVDVRDFGAVGDGVTDDTAAVQAAINSVAGSATIFFAKGNYLLGQITTGVKNEITFLGSGYRASWLTVKSGTNADFIVFGDGATYTAGCRVQGLRINGNSAGNSSGSLVRFRSTEDNAVAQCYLSDAKEHGIKFDGNGTQAANYLRVLDNYIVGNKGHGIYALNQAYGLKAIGNTIAGNGKSPAGGAGITMSSNDGHVILGNTFDENSHSVYLYAVSDTTVVGNFLQNQDRHGVLLDGGSIYNKIAENYILNPSNGTANTYAGVVVNDSTHNDIFANLIWARTVVASDGVKESGTSDNNDIRENRIRNTVTNPIVKVGASTTVKGNTGYKTEAEGTATIASGATISHGLAASPTSVQVTPRVAGRMCSVTARSSTTITVAIFDVATGLAIGGTEAVDWRASV